MARKDIIMISHQELKRLHIIHKVLEKKLKQVESAEILSLSTRHIGRIVKRVMLEGDGGIKHRARGRPSNSKLSQKLKDGVIKLYREKYKGFGPTLAVEKLFEINKIKISDETLRNWLVESGDWKRIRNVRQHRQWRERKHYFGQMIQVDGSHHDWFESRGERAVFIGYIDDATGNVFGKFYEYEGTIPFMDSFRRYIRKYGIPISVYFDKHTTYKSNAKPSIEDELKGVEPLSEVERALKELGVETIHANSPQAKGRVERLFRTLQDRLIKEMRLRGIKDVDGANKFLAEYLPMHNKRFTVEPQEKDNIHRPVPKGLNLDKILCIKEERVLRNDFTVAYDNKLYQVEDKVNGKKVVVEIRINGSMAITHKGNDLKFKEIKSLPKKECKQPFIPTAPKIYRPPADHPWRSFKFGKQIYQKSKDLVGVGN